MRKITRREALRLAVGASALTLQAQGQSAPQEDQSVVFDIKSLNITLGVTAAGHIVRLRLGEGLVDVPFHASTMLHDCKAGPVLSSRRLQAGGIEVVRRYTQMDSQNSCLVTERLVPTLNSIRWNVEIAGDGKPWTTAIDTQMAWLNPTQALFWTAWDSRVPASHFNLASGLPEIDPIDSHEPWTDPLRPAPFSGRTFYFGGVGAQGNAFSLPLASILYPEKDLGLSLLQSPEDRLLDMELVVSALGDVSLRRKNHRICSTDPLRFSMDFVSHSADWRPALSWYTNRYPQFFESPSPNARALDGSGAYSRYDGPLDRKLMEERAFSLNWNAHFEFPFLGMSIPPVKQGVHWKSWYQTEASLEKMEQYDASMKRQGFHVLEYFVITECGNYIQETPPPERGASNTEFWRDANDFVHGAIPTAVLRDANGKIQYSNWFNNVVVDPADPAWQRSLLEQARTLVSELPSCSGICIDRMDWLRLYNINADDGCSWIEGRPARSLVNSWKETVEKIAEVLHPAGKVLYCNTLVRRVDTLRHLDGIYDEYGDQPRLLNLTAFLSLCKPAIGWTRDINTLRPDPDALFQRHLHLGIFPTVALPEADHTITPDPWADGYYDDYGPLLNAIRGKRWMLDARIVSCTDEHASVNIFEVPSGVVIPITFGTLEEVTVVVRLPEKVRNRRFSAKVLHPGGISLEQQFATPDRDGCMRLPVALLRHCAAVQLTFAV